MLTLDSCTTFWLSWFDFFLFSGTVVPMLKEVIDVVPAEKLAVHFHDTYGQALSNILVSLQVTMCFILILKGSFYLLLMTAAIFDMIRTNIITLG